MAGSKYVIKRGDTLSKVAKANGLKSGQFLFDHKLNAKLKALRKKPESIQPGDVVFLPPPDLKSIKTHFTSKGKRMSIDVDGPKGLIFVQQKWAYNYNKQAAASNWTSQQKRDFHAAVDKAVWSKWSGKFRVRVDGKSEFAKAFKDTVFNVNFDIKWVTSGGHWTVNVLKIAVGGGHERSSVDWNGQTIQYPAGFIRQRRKTSLSHLRSLLASVTRFTPRKLTGGCDLGFIE
ncbi:MAG: LysM peptidoglycan-binding domain-containing protein, partial [Pirellulaceae bacterium]|nr:LysM peptidoglycan-binding domain-containing protein [Pirellulaceae bacterium]